MSCHHGPTARRFMPEAIPEKYRDLFQKRAFANLGTLMPDGRPQVTPVWCDFDGEHLIFNSAKGRQKDRNVRRDPRVAITLMDPENPYRYVEIRGRVVEITEDGASAALSSAGVPARHSKREQGFVSGHAFRSAVRPILFDAPLGAGIYFPAR